jgi:hypothetical protein
MRAIERYLWSFHANCSLFCRSSDEDVLSSGLGMSQWHIFLRGTCVKIVKKKEGRTWRGAICMLTGVIGANNVQIFLVNQFSVFFQNVHGL